METGNGYSASVTIFVGDSSGSYYCATDLSLLPQTMALISLKQERPSFNLGRCLTSSNHITTLPSGLLPSGLRRERQLF